MAPTARDPGRKEPPAAGPYRTSAAELVSRPATAPPRRRAPQHRFAQQTNMRYPGRLQRLQKQLMGDVVAGRCTQAEALIRWENAVSDWMFGK